MTCFEQHIPSIFCKHIILKSDISLGTVILATHYDILI